MDESINFISQCRKQTNTSSGNQVNANILFKEIQKSVQMGQGRSLTQSHFMQILNVVPHFYNHSWEKTAQGMQLAVEFNDKGLPTFDKLNARRKEFKEKLTEKCVYYYDQFR